MNQKPIIRAYVSADKPALLKILELNVPKYFAESELKDFENYLKNEIEQYFVVELNAKLIGAGGINFDKNKIIGKISWDFIHPEYQSRGIGKKLLQHRMELLKSMEIKRIAVRTSQLAYKFYEKNGFVLQEVTKDYWANGFDLYKMIYKNSLKQ